MWNELWGRIEKLEHEVKFLKRENKQLREAISTIKPISIEKITYKVQELHVETLSGTLNIGLTTQDAVEDLEGFVEKIVEKHGTNIEIGPKPYHPRQENPSEPLEDNDPDSSDEQHDD